MECIFGRNGGTDTHGTKIGVLGVLRRYVIPSFVRINLDLGVEN